MKLSRFLVVLLLLAPVLSLTGCPDYSHLREPPDYSNMTDSAPEEFGDE